MLQLATTSNRVSKKKTCLCHVYKNDDIFFFDKYVYNFTDLMKRIQSNDFISNNFALNGYFLGALYSTLFFVLPTL